MIDNVDMNGPCITLLQEVCVCSMCCGLQEFQAVLCDLGVFQIDSAVRCDDAVEITNTLENVIVDEDGTIQSVDLSNLFTVNDDAGTSSVQIYVHDVSPSNIITSSIVANTLNLNLLQDMNGVVNVTLRGQVGNNIKDIHFEIQVLPEDDAPRFRIPSHRQHFGGFQYLCRIFE